MTYDICKHHDSNRWLLLSDGKVIGSYTRKSSATRRMNALLATSAEMSNAALAVADKCASGALAADANAVQTPPASNTGGLQKVTRGVFRKCRLGRILVQCRKPSNIL